MHNLLFSYVLRMWSSLCKEYFSDNFTIIIWRKKKKNNTSNKKWPKKKVYGWLNSLSVWSSRKKQKHLCSCMKGKKIVRTCPKKCLPYPSSIVAGTLVRATAALLIEAGGWSREEPLSLFFQHLVEDRTPSFTLCSSQILDSMNEPRGRPRSDEVKTSIYMLVLYI